jgi:WD40 repeat protein
VALKTPRYAAFVSYSHDADKRFALALQAQIERFDRRWYRWSRVSVFVDKTRMAAADELWPSLQSAMEHSSWLVLIASPEAARSPFVAKELSWWIENKPPGRIALVLADGWLTRNPDDGHLDGSALPPLLEKGLSPHARWVPATWSRSSPEPSSDPELFDCAASVAASIYEEEKHTLVARSAREERRFVLLRRVVAAALTGLLVAVIAALIIALHATSVAHREAKESLARQLAATATALQATNLRASLVLAAQSVKTVDGVPERAALLGSDLASPKLERFFDARETVTSVVASSDGHLVVAGTTHGLVLEWNTTTDAHFILGRLPGAIKYLSVSADGSTVAAGDGTHAAVWRIGAPALRLAAPPGQHPGSVVVTADGRYAVFHAEPATPGGEEGFSILDLPSGRTIATHELLYGGSDFDAQLFSCGSDEVLISGAEETTWVQRAIPSWHELEHVTMVLGVTNEVSRPSSDCRYVTIGGGARAGDVYSLRDPGHRSGLPIPNLVANPPIGRSTTMALSPDARQLAVAEAGTIYVDSPRSPGVRNSATDIELTGEPTVSTIVFAGQSELISVSEGTIALWNLTQVDRLARRSRLPVASACEACGAAKLVLAANGRLAALNGNSEAVTVSGTSPGSPVVSFGSDGLGSWRLGLPVWMPGDKVLSVPVGPPEGGDEVQLPPRDSSEIYDWPAGDGREAIVTDAPGRSPTGIMLVTANGGIFEQDAHSGDIKTSVPGPPEFSLSSSQIDDAAIDIGAGLVAEIVEGEVSLRSLASNSLLRSLPVREASRVLFAGPWLLVGKVGGEFEVWSSHGTRMVGSLPGGSYTLEAAANDAGTVLARVRTNGEVVLNALPSGEGVGLLPSGEPRGILRLGVAFGPGGNDLATIMDPSSFGGQATVLQRQIAPVALLHDACRAAGGPLSGSEWKALIGRNQPPAAACS